MTDFKTERYSVSKPSHDQYGAAMTIYFKDDSYMNLDVEMSWCSRNDVVEIDGFHAEYYDHDDNELAVDIVEVEGMIVEICDHFNTFDKVEHELQKSYHADHA